MTAPAGTLRHQAINTIRTLSMDAVQAANSGHPGAPMGAAPMAYVLWTRHLRHNPADPAWPDRDRFVLSAGHASMLLYSLLYLTGYDLPLDEIKSFRQWGSKTPGHPEYGLTPGVETTTGPLGSGVANAVGMAIAERMLAARFNRPGHDIVDHRTYAFVSDGDLMEGIASEASSLAGTLGLGKLTFLYDDNEISIEGSTDLAFQEDVGERFAAYGWHVQHVDGDDLEAVDAALCAAQDVEDRPSILVVATEIAHGSPNKAGSAAAHGAALGEDEVRLTKEVYGWPLDPAFHVPEEALAEFRVALEQGAARQAAWQERFEAYARAFPDEAAEWRRGVAGDLPEGWEAHLPAFSPDDGAMATRAASGKVLNALASIIPNLAGGSGDLAPSNNTLLSGYDDFAKGAWDGRNLRFGVREHAMGGIVNGMAVHGGLIPYGGTFLAFSDWMRGAIRLGAIMGCHSIYVFTHDSIGVGEDGPTHQPIEQLLALRAIPGLTVLRPADANETAAAWKVALERRSGPTLLALTRQGLPVIAEQDRVREGVPRGAYILDDAPDGSPDIVLIATGSEVSLAREAASMLAAEGIAARVVSMPSWELFADQPQSYRDEVLPPGVTARLAIEAGTSIGWERYVGDAGEVLGIDRFGASAPGKVMMERYGFTAEAVVERATAMVARSRAAEPAGG
ncbi:MAG: transketolase [Dehalococcoidia bacterium]|nr:transketolase [Dehalococcoidia bacterium]